MHIHAATLAKLLAPLFDTDKAAFDLLEDADVPTTELPRMGEQPAGQYWREATRRIAQGLAPGEGLARLLDTALEKFPGSKELLALRAAPSTTADLRPWLDEIHDAHSELTPAFKRRTGASTLLQHIYVELRIAERADMQVWRVECREDEMVARPGGRWTLEQVLRLDPARETWITRRWLLYGDPGSGKTTLLRHLAASLADPGRDGEPPWIPVFESLPKLVHERRHYYPALLAERFEQTAGGSATTWLERLDALAESGRLLLLFDGLDEVPKEHHGDAKRILGAASRRWASASVVVTARPIGGFRPGRDFRELELLPFEEDDRRNFLARWLADGETPDEARADTALAAFRDPSVWELAGNPLYLTLLATLFDDGVKIPEKRSQLYAKIFDYLLEARHRPGTRAIRHRRAVETVLEELAWTMTGDDVDEEIVADLEARLDQSPIARDALTVSDNWNDQPRAFLEDVAKRTSILGPSFNDAWRYWHRTFREALTAERLADVHKAGKAKLLEHARAVTDKDAGRWAEPYALLVGRLDDPDALVRTLMKENRALGLRALATAQGLREETIQVVLKMLREKQGGSFGFKERGEVYSRIPELLDDGGAALGLLGRLGRDVQAGIEFHLLDVAMAKVSARWKGDEAVARQVERCRDQLFEHLPPLPPELFETVETKDGRVKLWREIPAGDFIMGGRLDREQPKHKVEIASPFRMAAVPVTNAQYRAFDPSFRPYQWAGVSAAELDRHPAVNITWYRAMAFSRWLSCHFPGARLPTEEEWEYACRAGSTTEYWSGDSKADLKRAGWYDGNSGNRTHAVAEKDANERGLYDVHGNIWEWALNVWSYSYRGRDSGIEFDPTAIDGSKEIDLSKGAVIDDQWRVLRGGSYWLGAMNVRSAYRVGWSASAGYWNGGFRVLLPSPRPPSD